MTRPVIDVHVHLATSEWLEGSIGPYRHSAEAFFGKTFTPVGVEDMVARYDALDMIGLLLGWDAERHTGLPAIANTRIADIVDAYPETFIGFG